MIPKFRAFIKLENAINPMQTVAKINFEKESVTIEQGLVFKFNNVKLMQSTGLIDVNGVEIYEGDVVNVTQYFGGHSFGQLPHVVKVSECNNNLMLILQSKQRFIPEVSFNFSRSEDYEVLGNIYQSPELLEVTE